MTGLTHGSLHPNSEFRTSVENPADRLIELIEAGLCGDFNGVRRVSQALVECLPFDMAPAVRARLYEMIRGTAASRRGPATIVPPGPLFAAAGASVVERPHVATEPLLLEEATSAVLSRFLEEVRAHRRLLAAGLEPRANMVIYGPPGTGKTAMAGHVAARLGRRFSIVRLDALASPLLGETARNLRKAFDAVRDPDGFLFLDEIDAIAKSRDDGRDVGEVKRVVNVLLQTLDALPPGAVVVAATNHPDMLDHAVWRRFPFQLELGLPGEAVRTALWELHLGKEATKEHVEILTAISTGMSGSDIREVARSARRMALLDERPLDGFSVMEAVLSSGSGRMAIPRRLTPGDRASIAGRLIKDDRVDSGARKALKAIGTPPAAAGTQPAPRRRKPVDA